MCGGWVGKAASQLTAKKIAGTARGLAKAASKGISDTVSAPIRWSGDAAHNLNIINNKDYRNLTDLANIGGQTVGNIAGGNIAMQIASGKGAQLAHNPASLLVDEKLRNSSAYRNIARPVAKTTSNLAVGFLAGGPVGALAAGVGGLASGSLSPDAYTPINNIVSPAVSGYMAGASAGAEQAATGAAAKEGAKQTAKQALQQATKEAVQQTTQQAITQAAQEAAIAAGKQAAVSGGMAALQGGNVKDITNAALIGGATGGLASGLSSATPQLSDYFGGGAIGDVGANTATGALSGLGASALQGGNTQDNIQAAGMSGSVAGANAYTPYLADSFNPYLGNAGGHIAASTATGALGQGLGSALSGSNANEALMNAGYGGAIGGTTEAINQGMDYFNIDRNAFNPQGDVASIFNQFRDNGATNATPTFGTVIGGGLASGGSTSYQNNGGLNSNGYDAGQSVGGGQQFGNVYGVSPNVDYNTVVNG